MDGQATSRKRRKPKVDSGRSESFGRDADEVVAVVNLQRMYVTGMRACVSCARIMHYQTLFQFTVEVAEARLRSFPQYLGTFDPTTHSEDGSESPSRSTPAHSAGSPRYIVESPMYAPKSPTMSTIDSSARSRRGSAAYSPVSPMPKSPELTRLYAV